MFHGAAFLVQSMMARDDPLGATSFIAAFTEIGADAFSSAVVITPHCISELDSPNPLDVWHLNGSIGSLDYMVDSRGFNAGSVLGLHSRYGDTVVVMQISTGTELSWNPAWAKALRCSF